MKITILNGNFQYIYLTKLKYWPYGTISIGCGAAWAFNECLVWKSQLHSAQVPLPINSARPCGMGAGRRFSIILAGFGCEVGMDAWVGGGRGLQSLPRIRNPKGIEVDARYS
jgi:hypothetical protein